MLDSVYFDYRFDLDAQKSRALVFGNGIKFNNYRVIGHLLERQSSTRANHAVVVRSHDLSEEVVKKV